MYVSRMNKKSSVDVIAMISLNHHDKIFLIDVRKCSILVFRIYPVLNVSSQNMRFQFFKTLVKAGVEYV